MASGDLGSSGKILVALGLSLGTNYVGHIPEDNVRKLRDMTAPAVEPRWFLDPKRWKWTVNLHYKAPGTWG